MATAKTVKKTLETAPKSVKATAKKSVVDTSEIAVIKTGGKQYKVSVGEVVKIEKIIGEYKVGDKIVFDQVLLWDNGTDTDIGTPYIAGAQVKATITEIGRSAKVIIMRYKQKTRSGTPKNGHRQPFFKVKIDSLK